MDARPSLACRTTRAGCEADSPASMELSPADLQAVQMCMNGPTLPPAATACAASGADQPCDVAPPPEKTAPCEQREVAPCEQPPAEPPRAQAPIESPHEPQPAEPPKPAQKPASPKAATPKKEGEMDDEELEKYLQHLELTHDRERNEFESQQE